MILIIALLILAVWAAVATVVELRRDGLRATPTDWRRVGERDVSQQADPRHGYR